jgi:hypothetical protein
MFGAEILGLLDQLAMCGRVAIFGGVLRDLALHGAAARPRDIDVVIECEASEGLAQTLRTLRPSRNRYGGFRLRNRWWSYDVWQVQETWAVRQGLVRAGSIDDLVRTTFFDWDAVLYEYRSGEITAIDGYFGRLSAQIVDVNLAENPNPLGNLVRALRLFAAGEAALGSRLIRYADDQLRCFTDEEVMAAEASAYRSRRLNTDSLSAARRGLTQALTRGERTLAPLAPAQLQFNAAHFQ